MYTTRMNPNTHINIHCHHFTHQSTKTKMNKSKYLKSVYFFSLIVKLISKFLYVLKCLISGSKIFCAMNVENLIKYDFMLMVVNHLRYGINHIQGHFNSTMCMIWSCFRQSRYTVIAISEQFYSQTVMFSSQSIKSK